MHPLRFLLAILTLILLIELVVLGWFFFARDTTTDVPVAVSSPTVSDITLVESLPADFDLVARTFVDIAYEKGAVYAYELLITASLAPNLDLHLLGHEVGKVLYEQQGMAAMQFCTQDLRNACSHAVVVNALLDHGLTALDEVHEACKKAPGGPGAYTMCFHGLGHGILAFTEYDFEKAVALCATLGTAAYGNEEAGQCVGGAVMEMRDGTHDRAAWEIAHKKFVDTENPLSLCQAPYIFTEAKHFCYSYITPFLFDAAGAQGNLPQEAHFAPAFAYCEQEPEQQYKNMCFAGFGKEFIVLAGAYDIQDIDTLPEAVMEKAASWCELAPHEEAVQWCKNEIVHSLFWGGENDPRGAVRYCSLFTADERVACFDTLYKDAASYLGGEQQAALCGLVPASDAEQCKTTLGVM